MKISKIPGFGSYGQYIDELDFTHLTDDQWIEIGKLHLKKLVTVIRNPIGLTKDRYYHCVSKFGPAKGSVRAHYAKKYGRIIDAFDPKSLEGVSEDDKAFFKSRTYMLERTEEGNFLNRIYGAKDSQGNSLGAFDHGDLGWHSNEGAQLTFAPEVSLMGYQKMIGSATGFVQTADFYQSVSNSFRSELDDMILVHKYIPGAINSAELDNKVFQTSIQANFCPVDGLETPLVMTSPGGIRGLHFPMSTVSHIKGVSEQESKHIIDTITTALLTDQYIFYHHYQHDNDLLLFDNSITNHNRLGGEIDRLAYRIQYEPCNLIDNPWRPYDNPEIFKDYLEQTKTLIKILGLENFKLPELDSQ